MNELDEMPAGRELDALIAERVMGWRVTEACGVYGVWFGTDVAQLPYLSTDIAAAWLVVEKLRERGFTLELCSSACVGVSARFWPPKSNDALFGSADTDPLAICRAALLAIEKCKA